MGNALIEGANEGDSEGISVGFDVGLALGDTDVSADGIKEVVVVGTSDGEALKSIVGGLEGSVDGTDDNIETLGAGEIVVACRMRWWTIGLA